jgi:hypothetical protein
LKAKSYFSGSKAGEWEAGASNFVSAGSSIAKDALAEAKEGRTEISFNAIYDTLITSWKSQTDKLMKKIFNGEEDNVKKLTDLFSGGKMLYGKGPGAGPDNENEHTDSWNREASIQRAFYAAAIPAAWAANRPAPIVVDFGASCEIDARKYFNMEPESYKIAWRCIDGHSYILAGVRDLQKTCGEQTPGNPNQCPPVKKWTFDILNGMGQIKDNKNKWGGVTVDELIRG